MHTVSGLWAMPALSCDCASLGEDVDVVCAAEEAPVECGTMASLCLRVIGVCWAGDGAAADSVDG